MVRAMHFLVLCLASIYVLFPYVGTAASPPRKSSNNSKWPRSQYDSFGYQKAKCSWHRLSADSAGFAAINKLNLCYQATVFHVYGVRPQFTPNFKEHYELKCEHSDLVSLESLMSSTLRALRGKTVTFVGDSVTLQQYMAMACSIHTYDIKDTYSTRDNPLRHDAIENDEGLRQYALPIARIDEYNNYLHFYSHNITFRMRRVGRLFGHTVSHYTTIVEEELNYAMSRNDIVVLNQGVHHNVNLTTIASKDENSLEAVIDATVRAYLATRAAAAKGWKQRMPLVIWRETTPQNHDTYNGWYGMQCLTNCHCVPINESMLLEGRQRGYDTNPDATGHYAPTFRNDLAKRLLRTAPGMLYLPIHDALNDGQVLFPIHMSPHDCTHVGMDGLMMMNQALITMISQK